MKHTLDATNKKLGRLATQTAVLLMNKNSIDFARNKTPEVQVEIINIDKLTIDQKKKEGTIFKKYSGYPGGLKTETLGKLSNRMGMPEVFKRVVSGMLPKNKLRSKMIKNLTVK
jgi:large subunit ribosomal protein L13